MKLTKTVLRGIAVTAALLVSYNMLIFVAIAMGKRVEYIPWLHFPLKLFISTIS